MRYLVAVIFPPLAVLLCGKPFQAAINVVLTLAFWLPGMVHALFVVHQFHNDRNTRRIVDAIERRGPPGAR